MKDEMNVIMESLDREMKEYIADGVVVNQVREEWRGSDKVHVVDGDDDG
ncbi:hypothetical protein DFA_02150 [Cavenderia fasciculata]|uniref:Uncharacterized protein n=1 Tax=Cavenderia fasciculata TaxID=261658 RepID=F4PY96_CACFS|nr:uncharacterized protein DFA_02150 [Cavenderia fasciculata]EGG19363.1 hypothetical protein DFA_02150 [Cavenderia fasciculata]|eukprot:XP_004357634.1 hypothetical protein DFA_02150 [Cavenderia fasciculata]